MKSNLIVTIDCHNMPGIQINNPTVVQRMVVERSVNAQFNSVQSELVRKSGAFLQCNEKNYILIEFWSDNYLDFVDFINAEIDKENENWKKEIFS